MVQHLHYKAAWTESWCHREFECDHDHRTLGDAAKCGMAHPGWYVFAVERDSARKLTKAEDRVVKEIRFEAAAESNRLRAIKKVMERRNLPPDPTAGAF